jgi:cytochrome c
MSTHKTLLRFAIGFAGVATAAAMGVVTAPAVQAAQEKLSVWDGVYAEEQATRGKDEYEYNCGSCHIHDLSGDTIKDVPPLAGPDFLNTWSGKTVKELLDYINTNMPQGSRGSLPANTVADVAAYVLKVNQFPAGSQPLSADSPKAAGKIEAEKTK